MYLIETTIRANNDYNFNQAATARFPAGPGFSLEQADRASYMEWWGSDFKEATEYNTWKLLDSNHNVIVEKTFPGY